MGLLKSAFTLVSFVMVLSSVAHADSSLQWHKSEARQLTSDSILKSSTSGAIKARSGRLILDNDAAFASKIEAIRSAKPGETIRLAYYIYTDDYSSSLFSKELILAAQRGVKVKVLIDALMGVKYYDLFKAMEQSSLGNLEVRFFGMPSHLIWRDAQFMTRPCPVSEKPQAEECVNHKLEQMKNWQPDFYAELLVSSIFSRSGAGAKLSILMGQLIDLKKYKEGASDPQAEEQLKELFKLVIDAKLKDDPIAALKLALALQMYGDQINPILNEVFGRLPLHLMAESSASEWEHLTDYLHHKLLLVGERWAQLGGRNIEDSYHMKANPLASKYIFMDADLQLEMTSGGAALARSYDELYNFHPRVQSLKSMAPWFKSDVIFNPEALGQAMEECRADLVGDEAARAQFSVCLEQALPRMPKFQGQAERIKTAFINMESKLKVFSQEYLPQARWTETWKSNSSQYDDQLSPRDLNEGLVTYIENLPYDRRLNPDQRKRTLGSINGRELDSGKGLHDLWVRGLEDACASEKETRVILHSAYFFPSSNLMRAFARMMDGTWDCRKVRVTILTNSVKTTDLSPINVMARYQMGAFFDIYYRRGGLFGTDAKAKAAKFEYFEHKALGLEGSPSKTSLHAKISILGDHAIVGSANGDVRSYYMDTNNGFLLADAKELAKDYGAYVDELLADPAKTTNLTDDFTIKGLAEIHVEAELVTRQILEHFNFTRRLKESTKQSIVNAVHRLGGRAYRLSTEIFAHPLIELENGDYLLDPNVADQYKRGRQVEAEAQFNRLFQVF